jgi:hypothetical protein
MDVEFGDARFKIAHDAEPKLFHAVFLVFEFIVNEEVRKEDAFGAKL